MVKKWTAPSSASSWLSSNRNPEHLSAAQAACGPAARRLFGPGPCRSADAACKRSGLCRFTLLCFYIGRTSPTSLTSPELLSGPPVELRQSGRVAEQFQLRRVSHRLVLVSFDDPRRCINQAAQINLVSWPSRSPHISDHHHAVRRLRQDELRNRARPSHTRKQHWTGKS